MTHACSSTLCSLREDERYGLGHVLYMPFEGEVVSESLSCCSALQWPSSLSVCCVLRAVLCLDNLLIRVRFFCFLLQDIVDDIQQECSSHGTVLSVIVPRPGEADASRAVGEAFTRNGTSVWRGRRLRESVSTRCCCISRCTVCN